MNVRLSRHLLMQDKLGIIVVSNAVLLKSVSKVEMSAFACEQNNDK